MLLAAFDSSALSYGSSKLFQLIMPLGFIILFRELLPFRQQIIRQLAQWLQGHRSIDTYQESVIDYNNTLDRIVGFMTWKIGCDLGFYLVSTGVGTWDRAFTWVGLLPYTFIQYFLYYYVGQKMLIDGQLNPFKKRDPLPTIHGRPSWFRQFVAKYFHESMNTTSYNIPLRQVLLKPLVDYGCIIVSWPFYTIGILFLQSGEFTLAPLTRFFFLQMLTFYSVNTFGFIVGFNIGEIIYLKAIEWIEVLERWVRDQPLLQTNDNGIIQLGQQLQARWKQVRYGTLWKIKPFIDTYGLNGRWLLTSASGVLFVIVIEPSFASTVFAISDQIQQTWFSLFGNIDLVHVQQIQHVTSIEMPPSKDLIESFPQAWNSLFFSSQMGA